MALIIISILIGLIATACLIYSIFAFQEKGPILDNKYLLATDEERRKIAHQSTSETKKDYRTTAIGFFWISVMFYLLCIGCVLAAMHKGTNYFVVAGIAVCAIGLIIYSLVYKIKSGEFR
jgi:ABC-type polysaccharide/polyol phosphate export permease